MPVMGATFGQFITDRQFFFAWGPLKAITNPPRQDTDQITGKRTVWVAAGFARQDFQQPRKTWSRVGPVGKPFAAHIWAPSRAPNRICDDVTAVATATAPQIMPGPCLPCLRGTSCALSFVLGWVGSRWTRDSSKRVDDDRWGDISALKANERWRRCRWRVQAEELTRPRSRSYVTPMSNPIPPPTNPRTICSSAL